MFNIRCPKQCKPSPARKRRKPISRKRVVLALVILALIGQATEASLAQPSLIVYEDCTFAEAREGSPALTEAIASWNAIPDPVRFRLCDALAEAGQPS